MWCTYESNEYADELDDVGVGNGVQAAEERVEDGDAGRQDDRCVHVDVDDHAQSCTCCTQSKRKITVS